MNRERETYLSYLDELRESGVINMFGAARYLQREFPELSHNQAKTVLQDWMSSFPRKGEE